MSAGNAAAGTPDATGTALLTIDHLTAGYGESQILTEMTFSVPVAGAVCLLGRRETYRS